VGYGLARRLLLRVPQYSRVNGAPVGGLVGLLISIHSRALGG
jgi:uncharacterized membrane-anchored protein YjiN (DUF445 family)